MFQCGGRFADAENFSFLVAWLVQSTINCAHLPWADKTKFVEEPIAKKLLQTVAGRLRRLALQHDSVRIPQRELLHEVIKLVGKGALMAELAFLARNRLVLQAAQIDILASYWHQIVVDLANNDSNVDDSWIYGYPKHRD